MKEPEEKQECCNLEMDNGIHGIDYPQKFVRAPKSCYPQKNSKIGEKGEPRVAMSMVLHAKR